MTETTVGAAFATAVAAKDRAAVAALIRNPEGNFVVEQQAYLSAPDGRINWLRVLCSGFRPTR